jgi:hypothetical protein
MRDWYRLRLKAAEITDTDIQADVDLASDGSAEAAVKNESGHDVLCASKRLRITLQNNSVKWRLNIEVNSTNPWKIAIAAIADASVGKPDVDLDSAGVTAAAESGHELGSGLGS